MSRVGIVAWNTFREAVRDRVLYNLVFFALLMMAAVLVLCFVPEISTWLPTLVMGPEGGR